MSLKETRGISSLQYLNPSPLTVIARLDAGCMAKSPLLIGSDVRSINASSLAILKNKDLIACEPPTLLLALFNGEP